VDSRSRFRFTPANPTLYEYKFQSSPSHGFSATLVRQVSFKSVLVGFSEDFVPLDDGRYLLSDAVLGSIWVVERDGTITPGIVPKSSDLRDRIPKLAYCGPMPEITVNGYPFLFTGSTLPGVSPLAVRDGTVYYYSPCARGLYSFPLAILSDDRQAYQRAADIRLVAATPQKVQVEELLDFQFNPYDPSDPYLYAADPLVLRVIRIDVHTGAREVIASGADLFDFPSSLAFLPPLFPGDRPDYDTELGCINRYKTIMRDKAALIVLDDIWNPLDVEPFRAESPRSRLLFTTRDESIAAGTGAQLVPTAVLTLEQSRAMLARSSQSPIDKLPAFLSLMDEACRSFI
jgi:hypothetical protein